MRGAPSLAPQIDLIAALLLHSPILCLSECRLVPGCVPDAPSLAPQCTGRSNRGIASAFPDSVEAYPTSSGSAAIKVCHPTCIANRGQGEEEDVEDEVGEPCRANRGGGEEGGGGGGGRRRLSMIAPVKATNYKTMAVIK